MSPVPPTRVREIDERRDNPERDGFSEIEESGLYEIKIEVTTSRQPIDETASTGDKISERISPLAIGEEDEVVKNLTSSSDSDDGPGTGPGGREMGGLRHSRMIRTAPSTAAFLSGAGLNAPTPPGEHKHERKIFTLCLWTSLARFFLHNQCHLPFDTLRSSQI